MTKEIEYVVCPMCGLNRPRHKTGSYSKFHKTDGKDWKRGPVRFDLVLIDVAEIVQIRENMGKRAGIVYRRGLTFEQMAQNLPEYEDILRQMQGQAKEIVQRLDSILPGGGL